MAREKGFVDSILSTKKQRQRFIYFRGLSSVVLGIAAYAEAANKMNDLLAIGLGILVLIVSYKTVSRAIAFLICLIEGMYS